jgi:hypothetical protein
VSVVKAYNAGNTDTIEALVDFQIVQNEDFYMTPSENMHVNVTRCRSDICTFKRSFAGQRKMMKSLKVFWPEWK